MILTVLTFFDGLRYATEMWSFFTGFLAKLPLAGAFPRVKADDEAEAEDLVDPQQVLRVGGMT